MQGITARVRYAKNGLARFIGHLDTARALLRAVRRTGVEALYTQGFTPRLCLSFSPPLPLGFTSDCEYLDIKLARRYDPETLKEKLQSRLPDGLTVTEVEVLGDAPSPLQTAFWATEYEITLGGTGFQPVNHGQHADATPSRPASDSVCPEEPGLADSPPETAPAAGHGEVAAQEDLPGVAGRESAIVDLFRREQEGGQRALSVVLRHDVPGGGRVKEVAGRLLGVGGADLERLRIHKKRVYRRGEGPLPRP